MDCPKCVGKLQKKQAEGIEIDVCFVCEGIWFDSNELKEILKRDSLNFKKIDLGREELDGKEAGELKEKLDNKTGRCPVCNKSKSLVKKKFKDVNVDICPIGHGLWLDGGEIHELRKRGSVDFEDKANHIKDLLQYAFSQDGFKDFLNRITGRNKKNNWENVIK